MNRDEESRRQIILRYLDGNVSPDELKEVEDLLRSDASARAFLRDVAEQAVAVRHMFGAPAFPAAPPREPCKHMMPMAKAAGGVFILLLIIVGLYIHGGGNGQNGQDGQDPWNGEAGGGLVKVTMNGKHEVRRVEIDDSLVGDDKEMLEDLVASACNDAVRRIAENTEQSMSSLTAGLNLPPGMKLPF